MIKVEKLNPFGRMCISLGMLPSSYKESLTYEEQLLWFFKYLDETVIPTLNNNADAIEEVQELYLQIKEYVDNYFENLDVQEEINNKLDDMAESGELTDIIAQYLQLAGVLAYNTVADMKEAENLTNGSIAKTLGYTSINDGGAAFYKIRNITNNDVVDEATIISIGDDTLIAELIFQDIYVEQFGAIGDGVTDDTENLQKAIDYCITNHLTLKSKGNKTFLISESLVINNKINIDLNGSTIITESAIDMLVFNYASGNEDQGYLKNLTIDMNEVATTGIKITRVVKKLISNIVIKNITNTGYQIDLGNEVIFENSHLYGKGNSSVGLRLNKGDCHYKDLIMIDVHTAIWSSSSNFYTRIHAWMKTRNLIAGSIFMKCDTTSNHFLNQCYSDTYIYPFYISNNARVKLSEHYNFNNQDIMTEQVINDTADFVYMFYYTDAAYSRFTTVTNSVLTGYPNNTSLAKYSNISEENLLSFVDANSYVANWGYGNFKINKIDIDSSMITGTTVDLVGAYANKFLISGNVINLNLKVATNQFIPANTATLIGKLPDRYKTAVETVFTAPITTSTYNLKNQAFVYILPGGSIYFISPNDVNTNDQIIINKVYVTGNNQP